MIVKRNLGYIMSVRGRLDNETDMGIVAEAGRVVEEGGGVVEYVILGWEMLAFI